MISDEHWKLIPLEIQAQISPTAPEEGNKKIMPQNFSIVRDFHFTIGPNVLSDDDKLFFGVVAQHLEKADIFDLLVLVGAFKSKNEARKNWRGIQAIPDGYFEVGPVGKSRIMIFALNAI